MDQYRGYLRECARLGKERITAQPKQDSGTIEEIAEANAIVAKIDAELETLTARIQALTTEFRAWWSELWSQGPEGTRCSPEEVKALYDQCQESDPGLWEWLQKKSWALINEHREIAKKN
jgi:hypothetical protein